MHFAGLSEQESVAWTDYLRGLEWHLDPLDMNTFNGLIQSYKDNRIDSTQLYTLVYAMFHAISALHLFPMFKAFTPWRDQDTTWFDSRIRRALCDDILWNQICVQVKLSPQQTLTAVVRHSDGSIRHKEVSCAAPPAMFFPKFPLRMSGIPVAVSAAAARAATATTVANVSSTSIEQQTSPSRVVRLKLAKEHLLSSPPAIKSSRHTRIVKLKTGKTISLPKPQQKSNKHITLIASPSNFAVPNDPTITLSGAGRHPPILHPDLGFSYNRTFKSRPPPLKLIPVPPNEGPPFSPLTPLSPRTPPISPLTPPPALSFPVASRRQASSSVSAIQSEVLDTRARQMRSCTSAEMEGLGGEDAMIGDEIVEMDLGELFDGGVDGGVDGVGEGGALVQQVHGEVLRDAGAVEIDGGVVEDATEGGDMVLMGSGEMELDDSADHLAIEDDEEDAEFELEEW